MIPDSATVTARQTQTEAQRRLVRSKYANLVRDSLSGTFFARAKVHGRLVRRSLKTKSVTIARLRLAELLEEERAKAPSRADVNEWRMATVMELWAEKIKSSQDLAPRSRDYRLETLALIKRSWPDLAGLKPDAVDWVAAERWRARVQSKYSPSRVNGCIESLRAIFRLAIELGIAGDNPAASLERLPARRLQRALPPPAVFRKLLAALQTPSRRRGGWMVRVLAFSGLRPEEVRRLRCGDVDLANNRLTVPPLKHRKSPMLVPISAELRSVLKELLAAHPGDGSPLLPVRACRKSLAGACKAVGIPKLQMYDLRRLFATHLLESGVPAAIVAAFRGDRDGGAMLSKTYFQAREAMMTKAMNKVKW